VATEWHLGIEWPRRYWYTDPELVLTFFAPEGTPYAVAVELRRDNSGPFVTGVAVRRSQFGTDWDGRSRTHVAPRDIQRLPLARVVRAALAAAATLEWAAKPVSLRDLMPSESEPPDEHGIRRGSSIPGRPAQIAYDPAERGERYPVPPHLEWADTARKVLVPRGRPRRGKAASFYKEVANSYRELAYTGTGASPVKEIARRKRVSENTVHQWVHRARKLGFLDPSPRTKRREQTDA
jgi:hypothetical protein